jgi:hypothetical protein
MRVAHLSTQRFREKRPVPVLAGLSARNKCSCVTDVGLGLAAHYFVLQGDR